jgi:hypothetical protein
MAKSNYNFPVNIYRLNIVNHINNLLLTSRLATVTPTHKHCYAAPKNVEFCTLFLHNMAALLAKCFARLTRVLISEVCVAFIGACHDCCQLLLLPVVVVATIIGLVEALKYGRQRWELVFFFFFDKWWELVFFI